MCVSIRNTHQNTTLYHNCVWKMSKMSCYAACSAAVGVALLSAQLPFFFFFFFWKQSTLTVHSQRNPWNIHTIPLTVQTPTKQTKMVTECAQPFELTWLSHTLRNCTYKHWHELLHWCIHTNVKWFVRLFVLKMFKRFFFFGCCCLLLSFSINILVFAKMNIFFYFHHLIQSIPHKSTHFSYFFFLICFHFLKLKIYRISRVA